MIARHDRVPPTLSEFLGDPTDHATRAAKFHAAWDKVDRALARH